MRARRHLVGSFREAGHDLVVVTETLEDRADLVRLVSAVAPEHVFLVRLDSEVETLQKRITAREPAAWSGLSELVTAAERLASAMRLLPDVDLVVSTEAASTQDVAARIVAALDGWRRSD